MIEDKNKNADSAKALLGDIFGAIADEIPEEEEDDEETAELLRMIVDKLFSKEDTNEPVK